MKIMIGHWNGLLARSRIVEVLSKAN